MFKSQIKQCQNCKADFIIESEDFAFYEKISVPSPTFCYECRTVRKMLWRNERTLYKRKCDAPRHNEDIVSIYHKERKLTVYDQKYWWSDEWDSMKYGRDYDWDKPFFEQWRELRDIFPLMSLSNSNAVNSDFCNVSDRSKDSYLASASYEIENVMYSNRIAFDKDSMDLYIGKKSELCYENIICWDSYKLFYSRNSNNCLNSYFLFDCRNCQNCFGCVNLRNKSYNIFNKQYTKEEYEKKIKEIDLGSFKNILKFKSEFEKIYEKAIHKYANINKSVNVTGDNLINSKNSFYSYDIDGIENSKFIQWGVGKVNDVYDSGPGIGDVMELCYEVFDSGIGSSRLYFTSVVYGSYNVAYSFNCYNSSNLFGCIGLRNKQYCILNKQYTEEEYEKLLPKIIRHMG